MILYEPCLVLCLQDLSKVSSVGEVSKAVKPITVSESACTANDEQHLDKAADK